MIPYPNIDPEIVRIGPFAFRWYGVMYLIGFAAAYLLVKYQVEKKNIAVGMKEMDSLYSFLILGLIIGARLGYILFYNLADYIKNPLEIFAVWRGGMSFHGGLIGCIAAGILFCRRFRLNYWQVSDLVVVTAPIGLGLGRLGNFINGELYGRVTNVPWAMVFPGGGPLPRHPSQLYESLLEGLLLFTVLWTLRRKPWQNNRLWPHGSIFALFLSGYGCIRIIVEGFREPDQQ